MASKSLILFTAMVFGVGVGVANADTRNGDLDPNFGTNGQSRVDIGTGSPAWVSMDSTQDGGILLAGSYDAGLPTGYDFVVTRLLSNGTLDTSFSFDGKVQLAVGSGASNDAFHGMLVQPDGKIILVGTALSPDIDNGIDMAIVRLDADGSLDAGFGVGGKVFIDFGLGGAEVDEIVGDVARFADGKLIVAGSTPVTGEGQDMALVKLNTDGSRDTSFGIGGRVAVRFDLSTTFLDDRANAVAVDSQGRVVVAGATNKSSTEDSDFAVARLLSNGLLDGNFSGDGLATIAFDFAAPLMDTALGLLVESDDSLTLVGQASDVGTDFAIVRLYPDGSPVADFGNAGRVTVAFDLGEVEAAFDVVRTETGRLLAVGPVQVTTAYFSGLVQLLPDGNLDPEFGIVGKSLIGNEFGGVASAPTTVRVVDGHALVGGIADDGAGQVGLYSAAVLIDVLFADDFDSD